jgi:hypothetical protein
MKMKTLEHAVTAGIAALWLFHAAFVAAQQEQSEEPAADQASVQPAPEDVFPPDQVEQLVAPIALYPDALLAQVLMASTYPLDVVQAARWQKQNPDLKDEALESAAAEEPWDQSVKTLLFFPDVLTYMNDNLSWTQDLGDAVLAQQDDVTDAVQVLRTEAKAAGNLQTTEQQRVEVEPAAEGDAQAQSGGETIIIQPADPQVVYVPSYNPSTVYGQTEPPATTYYPAAYTTPTTSYVSEPTSSDGSGLVSFGVGALAGGLLTAAIMWDDDDDYDRIYYGGPGYYGGSGYWNRSNYWDGGYRRPAEINIDRNVNIERGDVNINREVKKWEHNPERRGGVRYRDKDTQRKFAGVRKENIDRDIARGRDPDRKPPDLGGRDRPQLADRDRPAKGDVERPGGGEPRRPATREAKRPKTKDIERPAPKQARKPQRRDVELNKPRAQAKRPVARPSAEKVSKSRRAGGSKSSAFKTREGGQARAAKSRGAKSRGGGRTGRGGGRRG